MKSFLETIYQQVSSEHDVFDNYIAIVCGDRYDTDLVKLEWLRLSGRDAVSLHLFHHFSSLASLWSKSRELVLTSEDKLDILSKLLSSTWVQEEIGTSFHFFKSRAVQKKAVRVLDAFDGFFSEDAEAEAMLEYLLDKDEVLGKICKIVFSLWSKGQLFPWGKGALLRRALQSEKNPLFPKKIFFLGLKVKTPLEQRFLEMLAENGVELLFEPEEFNEKSPVAKHVFHSCIDEIEHVCLSLQKTDLNRVAVLLPLDPSYQSYFKYQLLQKKIPYTDVTSTKGLEFSFDLESMFWKQLFKFVSKGFEIKDLQVLLGSRSKFNLLFEEFYKRRAIKGARHWKLFSTEMPTEVADLFLDVFRFFSKRNTVDVFFDQVLHLLNKHENVLTEFFSLQNKESSILLLFSKELLANRPYLEGKKIRIQEYAGYFDDFLEKKRRLDSASRMGDLVVGEHGKLLPFQTRKKLVLSLNFSETPADPVDVYDFDPSDLEIRSWQKIWNKIHSADKPVRSKKEIYENELKQSIFSGEDIEIGFSKFDFSGNEKDLTPFQFTKEILGEENISPLFISSLWTEDDLTQPEKIKTAIKGTNSVSVTAFEDYLKCPYVYYSRHILKLEPSRELGSKPEPAASGDVFHRLVSHLTLIEKNTESFFGWTKEKLHSEVERFIGQIASKDLYRGMVWSKPLEKIIGQRILGQVQIWFEWEKARRDQFPDLRPHSVEEAVEYRLDSGLVLRGRIDRVDVTKEYFSVLDYKTGEPAFRGAELLQGFGAQLFMYAKSIYDKTGIEPGALYYAHLSRKMDVSAGVFFKSASGNIHKAHPSNKGLTPLSFSDAFEVVKQRWEVRSTQFLNGDFAANPTRPKECTRCAFKGFCGWKVVEDTL